MGVGRSVSVGVRLAVGVSLGLGMAVGSVMVGPAMPERRAKYTTTAPMTTNTTSRPSAAGNPSVISGMRVAWTDFSAWRATLGAGAVPSTVPQTRQRVAFSLNRVPQVGQIFVFDCDGVSRVIRAKIIHHGRLGSPRRMPGGKPTASDPRKP